MKQDNWVSEMGVHLTDDQQKLLHGLTEDWKNELVDMLTRYQNLVQGVTSRAKDPETMKRGKEAKAQADAIFKELAGMRETLVDNGFTHKQAKACVSAIYTAAGEDARAASFHPSLELPKQGRQK